MKRMIPLLLALALLAGCGGKEAKTADPQEIVDAYLESQAFSDHLEALDSDIALPLLGIDPEDVSDSQVYLSEGATAEELTVITAVDGDAAERVNEALSQHVADQRTAVESYQPGEVEKLDNAVRRTAGNVVVLMVAADWEFAAGIDGILS
ncbi:MAG: DUF4358 domain-containing protein [Oscillospiraceae bacterium]|nr:DUF4358 domain-containing protein [Oscillospiraceae bacterium]